MLRTQFVVVPYDGLWRVRSDGKHYGPYTTQRQAIRAAIDAAFAAASRGAGHAPRVLVQSVYNDQLQVEWTYGEDPYPPLH